MISSPGENDYFGGCTLWHHTMLKTLLSANLTLPRLHPQSLWVFPTPELATLPGHVGQCDNVNHSSDSNRDFCSQIVKNCGISYGVLRGLKCQQHPSPFVLHGKLLSKGDFQKKFIIWHGVS